MTTTEYMPILGTVLAIQMSVLNEEQAMANHGQTLSRLKERGGITPQEALDIIERRPSKFGLKDRIKSVEMLSQIKSGVSL